MKSTEKAQQKSYRKGSSLYFSAGLLLSMVLILTAFEWKFPYQLIDTPIPPEDITVYEDEFKPIAIPAPPTPPKQGTQVVEIPDNQPTVTEPPIDLLPSDDEDIDPTEGILDGLLGADKPFGDEETTMPEINRDAKPADGFKAFYDYLYKNLQIPDHLLNRMVDEKIVVSFVVDKDGQLTDLQIVEGFDKGMEKQVLKLLQEGPGWEPAWRQGRKVNSRKMLPIVIKTTR